MHTATKYLLWLLLVLVAATAACSDSNSSNGGNGWGLEDDAGADAEHEDAASSTDTGEAEPDTDIPTDVDESNLCPSGAAPEGPERICQTVLLANSERSPAFGGETPRSSWVVAKVDIDGQLHMQDEHTFDADGPMFVARGDQRVFLVGVNENRVRVLDRTSDFEIVGDYSIPPPDPSLSSFYLTSDAAYASGVDRSYLVLGNPSATLAVIDHTKLDNQAVDYVDLSDSLGDDANINALAADDGRYLVGLFTRGTDSYLFAFDASTNSVVDLDDSTSEIDMPLLPETSESARLRKLPSEDFLTDLGPMSASTQVDGGLYRIARQQAGRYTADEYLITSQELVGTTFYFRPLSDTTGLATVESRQHGVRLLYYEVDTNETRVEVVDVPGDGRVTGLCLAPDRPWAWLVKRKSISPLNTDTLSTGSLALNREHFEADFYKCVFAK